MRSNTDIVTLDRHAYDTLISKCNQLDSLLKHDSVLITRVPLIGMYDAVIDVKDLPEFENKSLDKVSKELLHIHSINKKLAARIEEDKDLIAHAEKVVAESKLLPNLLCFCLGVVFTVITCVVLF